MLRTTLLLASSALLLLLLITTLAAAVESSHNNDAAAAANNSDDSMMMISQAIAKSRQHLSENTPPNDEAPYAFPKTRYRLALMLEQAYHSSNSNHHHQEVTIKDECIQLYKQAARNTTMPGSMRIDSLYRAARLIIEQQDDDHNNNNNNDNKPSSASQQLDAAESLLIEAMGIGGDDDDVLPAHHQQVFEYYALMLRDSGFYHKALTLCQQAREEFWPDNPLVDEIEASVYRIMIQNNKDDESVSYLQSEYDSLASAAHKSHKALVTFIISATATGTDDKKQKDAISLDRFPYGQLPPTISYYRSLPQDEQQAQQYWDLIQNLFRLVFLAGCSARHAGLSQLEDQHFDYGLVILSAADHEQVLKRDKPSLVTEFLVNVGIRHKRRAKYKVAADFFGKALEVSPGDGHALAQLASIGEQTTATSLSKDYVEGLFDGYAYRFEHELVNKLDYHGHEYVVNALFQNGFDDATSTGGRRLVIDLGCGTGLAGRLLRERVVGMSSAASCSMAKEESNDDNDNDNKLVVLGVDLSPKMVKKARASEFSIHGDTDEDGKATTTTTTTSVPTLVYDKVEQGEAIEFLQSQLSDNSVDAIMASDVLIYIGALDDLFVQCARVLKRRSGIMTFTVESHPPNEYTSETGVTLLKSGRFGHTKEYVTKLAKQTDFQLVEWREKVLRKQGGKDVHGAVVTLVRNGDNKNSSIE